MERPYSVNKIVNELGVMKKLSVLLTLISMATLPLAAQTAAGGASPGTAAPSSGATTAPSGAGTTPSAGLPGTPGTLNPNSPTGISGNPNAIPNGAVHPTSPNNPTINGVNSNPTAVGPQAGQNSATTNMP